MFKRSSKLTSLLVAVAAVVSVAPAANAAERLGTQEGTINTIVSFEGNYIFDGYKDDDQDTSIYYNNGEADTEIEDADDYEISGAEKYGDKYIVAKDGGSDDLEDAYLLDLTSGKIDEESISDKVDNIASNLKSKLKKTDRYGKDITKPVLTKMFDNTYGDIWYSYSYDSQGFFGFVNDKGEYIDVSNLANVYVYSSERKKNVKVEEYDDKSDDNITVQLKNIKPLTQDSDYIYALATVTVTEEVTDEDAEEEESEAKENKESTQYFLQKISKAQGEKKDDAYIPKSVTSYYLEDQWGDGTTPRFDCEDSNKAYQLVSGAYDGYTSDESRLFNVKDNVIYATGVKDDSVKMFKIVMKKDKIDLKDGSVKKVDTYIAKVDGDCDHDIVNGKNAVSIDINGDTWALDKGKILKYDGDGFKEIHTCDRSLTDLEVYDEKNLAVWNTADEIYTTIQEGTAEKDEDTSSESENKDGETTDGENKDGETTEGETTEGETKSDKAGWDKNADGTWSYYKDGATVKGQWVQDGNWYYIKEDGIMATGWIQDKGEWYYLNASGAMAYGWIQDTDGNWYYLSTTTGAMLANTTVDGYVLGANGAWVK